MINNEITNIINYKPVKEVRVYYPNSIDNDTSTLNGSILAEDKLEFSSNPNERLERHNTKIRISVMDVAVYILEKIGKCTTMKLHKLLYYCQAWSLVWDETPLFDDKIEAWANGPVIRRLFNYHKGLFEVSASDFSIGNSQLLNETQRETVDSVLNFYGDKTAQWLINLTHSETPWLNARKGLSPSERGYVEIKLSDMADYYSSL